MVLANWLGQEGAGFCRSNALLSPNQQCQKWPWPPEMVTTFTYRPSLVKIDARNF